MGSVPYTAPFNISGMPAVSIPVGISVDGLPVGLQVVARRHEEELVLACGAIAEQNRPWPKFAPMAYLKSRTGVSEGSRRPCHSRRFDCGFGYPARRDRYAAEGRAAAAPGAGSGVGRGHRGRAGRAAHAAADLDAGPRSREHVRPRRRPRAHRDRSRPARSAVVEGVEATAQDRGLQAQGRAHRGRHALASRSLRRRGSHRARDGRRADHAPRVLHVDGEGPEPAPRAHRRRSEARRDRGRRARAVARRRARRAADDQRRRRRRARRHRGDRGDVEPVGRDHAVGNP